MNDSLEKFITKHIILILLVISLPLVGIVIFILMKYCFHKVLGAQNFIELISAMITYIGTVLLGVLAFWQNDRTNEINNRLLKIQESHAIPYLSISSNIIKFMDYSKMQPNESFDKVSCTYGSPNKTLIIPVKNITDISINRVILKEVEITGVCHCASSDIVSDIIFDSKEQNLLINSCLEPKEEKIFRVSININKNPYFYSQLYIIMKLKIYGLTAIEPCEQYLNLVALNTNNDLTFYIVSKDIFDSNTYKTIYIQEDLLK